MSSALTLARPYARAVFELAHAAGTLGDWSRWLGFAAEAAHGPAMTALFGDPRVDTATLVQLLLPPDTGADSDFAHFLAVLAENDRLPVLPEIAALYERQREEAERTLKVNVRTAALIDQDELDKLKAALRQRLRADIVIEQTLDPSVLGGAVIDAGHVVIDGSVRGRLARLQQALAQ